MSSPTPSPVYNIYLRDKNYQRIERLDVWSKLTFVKRFNRVGTWNLEVPTESQLAKYVLPDTGIIIQRDGKTIFSGPGGGDYEEDKSTIRASGTDDMVLLETPTRPTPSQAQGPYNNEYDVSTGIASTVMISLVNRNIGPAAPTTPVNWRIPGLTMAADPNLGSTITSRTRFDPLLIMLAELASTPIATGLGFDLLQADNLDSNLIFKVYQPQDRSDVVFSVELHTAQDYNHRHTTPSANYFMVGGGDNFGIERTVLEGGDATSISEVGRPVAAFVDRRGVQDTSELAQELAELIAGAVSTDIVTIIPTDVPSLVYGTNYELGDLVTAVVKGQEYARLIREIEIDMDVERGPIVTPSVADPSASNDSIGSQHLDTLSHRISNMERNWNVPDDSLINDMMHPFMKAHVGKIEWLAQIEIPPGWLACDGALVPRSQYPELFAKIGTAWNYIGGEPSTHFRVPDLRGRMPIMYGPPNFTTFAAMGGTTTLTINGHTHADRPHDHPGGTLHFPHNHRHSHGGGNLNWPHVHQHSHGMVAHRHHYDHNHAVPQNQVTLETNNLATVTPEQADAASKSHGHGDTTSPNGGVVKTGSGEVTMPGETSGPLFDTTQPDNNGVSSASPWIGGTDPDATGSGEYGSPSGDTGAANYSGVASPSGGFSTNIMNPYAVLYAIIFANA